MLQLLSSIVLICLSSFKLCLCVISLEWQAYLEVNFPACCCKEVIKVSISSKVSQPGTAAAAIHRVVYLDPAQLIYSWLCCRQRGYRWSVGGVYPSMGAHAQLFSTSV